MRENTILNLTVVVKLEKQMSLREIQELKQQHLETLWMWGNGNKELLVCGLQD